MKNWGRKRGASFLWAMILLGIAIALFFLVKPISVCDKPLAYSIGVVDDEFGISRETFLNAIMFAEEVWEEGMGIDLFNYNPEATFNINLIFDERQLRTIAEKRTREVIERGGGSYDTLKERYDALVDVHDTKLKQYEASVSPYETRLTSYNDEVAYYNSIGGAPKGKYNELERTRLDIEQATTILEGKMVELNALNGQVGILADEVNALADTYNTEVVRYNRTFGEATIFDQGEYTGGEINIYQFDQIADLHLVLAHELGHALHLGHVEGASSVMYYLMGEQNLNTPALSTEDIAALKTGCGL